jgi:hypothetical protein
VLDCTIKHENIVFCFAFCCLFLQLQLLKCPKMQIWRLPTNSSTTSTRCLKPTFRIYPTVKSSRFKNSLEFMVDIVVQVCCRAYLICFVTRSLFIFFRFKFS